MAFSNHKLLLSAALLIAGLHLGGMDYFGAGVHLIFGEGEPRSVFDLMRQTGFNSVRDEFNWQAVENPVGHFAMPESYLFYLKEAYRNNLIPLVLLAYGHSGYDNSDYPRSPEALNAYSQYAATVAGALAADRPQLIQIWNEWDGGTGMRSELAGTGDVASYLALIRKTVPAIRRNAPGAAIITNSYTKAQNFEAAVDAGVLGECDAAAMHTYNYFHGPQANAENWKAFVNDAIVPSIRRSSRPEAPLYVTEMGYPTSLGQKGREYSDAAAQHVRIWLLAQTMPQIRGLYIYNLVNTGYDPWNDEHNFGLTEVDLTPKDALYAVRGLLSELSQAQYEGEIRTSPDGIRVLKFRGPGRERALAAWSSYFDDEWRISLQLKAEGSISITQLGYRPYKVKPEERFSLTLGAMPWIIRGDGLEGKVLSVERIPRPDVIHDAPEKLKLLPRALPVPAAASPGSEPVEARYREIPPQEVWRGDKGWHGREDFSGEIALQWSPDFLQYEFRIVDDHLQSGECADRISLLLNHCASGSDTGGRLELEIRFDAGKPQCRILYSGAPEAAEPVVSGKLEKQNTWYCSVKIPAASFGVDNLQPGDVLESKIKVLDYDDQRADKYTILSYGLNTNEFLILEPK